MNRAICEVIETDDNQTVVSKVDEKVFFVEDIDLRLMRSLIPSGSMTWDPTIIQGVKDRYEELTRDI